MTVGPHLREVFAASVPTGSADAELTRREALKRLGLIGLTTTTAGALLTACLGDGFGGRNPLPPPGVTPFAPPDVVNGAGAWRMIGWGNNSQAGTDSFLWSNRGFGGFKTSVAFLSGFGGGYRFKGSTALHDDDPAYAQQRAIEQGGLGAPGTETYVGCHFRNARRDGADSPFDWYSDAERSLFATRLGEMAAFCRFRGFTGISADTEQGFWGLNFPSDMSAAKRLHRDTQTMARIESWGYTAGQAVYAAMPDCITLVYNWNPIGGFAIEEVYRPDPTIDNRPHHPDDDQHPTTLWYQQEAFGPKHLWWLGWAKAMADFGGPNARLVELDAFYYKPGSHRGASVPAANAYKYATQGAVAQFSQPVWTGGKNFSVAGLADAQWSKICDRVDFTFFSWAGQDWDQTRIDEGKRPTGYRHTPEPDFTEQLRLMRRYGMGSRRGEYNYEGNPGDYQWYDPMHNRSYTPAPPGATLANWYVTNPWNRPSGHVRGMLIAASRRPVSRTPPSLTANAPINNRDGTFTLSGAAAHVDGIRCVRAYVHPNPAARIGARLTWNPRGGTPETNYDAATQDYRFTIAASPGQHVIVTAVSIHEQEHSILVQL